jgi:hypothetical protein
MLRLASRQRLGPFAAAIGFALPVIAMASDSSAAITGTYGSVVANATARAYPTFGNLAKS